VLGDALSLFITRSCFGPRLQFSVGAGGRDGVIVRAVDGEKVKVTGFLFKSVVCEWQPVMNFDDASQPTVLFERPHRSTRKESQQPASPHQPAISTRLIHTE
jgi:hypothetical protein